MKKYKKIKRKLNKTLNEKRKELLILTAFIIGVAVIGYTGQAESYEQFGYDYKNPAISLRTTESRPVFNETHDNKPKITATKLITNKPEIETQIREIARAENFQWIDYLVKLADCESKLDPKAINDKNNTPKESKDRGLFQFNSYWQKRISDDCAFNLDCSTKEAMKMINAGKQHLWACNDIVLAKQ